MPEQRTPPPAGLARVWGPDLCEEYEERAAILEYDGCMSRAVAERRALQIVGAIHQRRVEARTEALRQRPPEEIEAERAAQAAELSKVNAEYAENAKRIWPNAKGLKR